MTDEILSRIKISEVYRALTGAEPRRTGRNIWRGPATWRDGGGLNVSMDDSRGVWHDFVTDEGGGVLDLVQHVRGCSRQDALRWCADLAGISLDDRPLSPEDRAQWVADRQQLERDLPDARYWRRGVIEISEETLHREKSRLFDPTEGPADVQAISDITAMLARLRAMGDGALVAHFREWRQDSPGWTWALIRWARKREQAELRALCRYLGFPQSVAAEYLRGMAA